MVFWVGGGGMATDRPLIILAILDKKSHERTIYYISKQMRIELSLDLNFFLRMAQTLVKFHEWQKQLWDNLKMKTNYFSRKCLRTGSGWKTTLSAWDKFCLMRRDKVKFQLSRYVIKLQDLPNEEKSCCDELQWLEWSFDCTTCTVTWIACSEFLDMFQVVRRSLSVQAAANSVKETTGMATETELRNT